MTKAELIRSVSKELGVTKSKGEGIVSVVFEGIIAGVKEDGEAVVPGIGKLVLVDTKATSGSMNGKAWSKPAGKALKLKLSKEGKSIA